jgi:hypothetical protein
VRILLAAVIAVAAGQAAPPLVPAKLPVKLEAKQLSVTTSQSHETAAAGAAISLFVDVFPKPKMHVYAPEQTGGYIRIELTLDDQAAVKEAKPIFPKAADYYFDPLKETFKVFDAPFRIRQDVTLAGPSSADALTITGSLRYQACDDQVCYRPDTVKVSWTVRRRPAA